MMPTQNIGSAAQIPASRELSSSAARQAPVESARPAAPLESPVAAVKPAAAPPDAVKVKQAIEMINKTIQTLSRNLEFSVDKESKENVVKVVDTDTGDVIRQIPSEETLQIAKALDQLQGLIIKQKA
ncbi:MAG: flagellar protein FlaG [Sulfuricella sp.]